MDRGKDMKKYHPVEISEKQLEDFIRQAPELIEEGLSYVDHQRITDRGPLDVLLVDSGGALIVAELKISEDDSMLVQGIDYYDYVTQNIDGLVRSYKRSGFNINSLEEVRLFLIAPSFSQKLVNRCRWINMPISLFTFKTVTLEGEEEVIPFFFEKPLPSIPEPIVSYTLQDRLNYITDAEARSRMETLLEEIQNWDKNNISLDPIKYAISLKRSGTVFTYIIPRRKFFIIYTNDKEGNWTGYPIHGDDELDSIKPLVRTNAEEHL